MKGKDGTGCVACDRDDKIGKEEGGRKCETRNNG